MNFFSIISIDEAMTMTSCFTLQNVKMVFFCFISLEMHANKSNSASKRGIYLEIHIKYRKKNVGYK